VDCQIIREGPIKATFRIDSFCHPERQNILSQLFFHLFAKFNMLESLVADSHNYYPDDSDYPLAFEADHLSQFNFLRNANDYTELSEIEQNKRLLLVSEY
jgi:hypothetical protein